MRVPIRTYTHGAVTTKRMREERVVKTRQQRTAAHSSAPLQKITRRWTNAKVFAKADVPNTANARARDVCVRAGGGASYCIWACV
jgi:hypothetical protein